MFYLKSPERPVPAPWLHRSPVDSCRRWTPSVSEESREHSIPCDTPSEPPLESRENTVWSISHCSGRVASPDDIITINSTHLSSTDAHPAVIQTQFLQRVAGGALQQLLDTFHSIGSESVIAQIQNLQPRAGRDDGGTQRHLHQQNHITSVCYLVSVSLTSHWMTDLRSALPAQVESQLADARWTCRSNNSTENNKDEIKHKCWLFLHC